MYIGYKFDIPEDTVINEGQTFTVNIPNEFAKILKNTDGISLETEDGVVVGTVVYSTDNTVQITFNEFTDDHPEVTGYFWLGRQLNESEIGNTNPASITFEAPYTASQTFYLNFIQTPFTEIEPTITKTGEYSAQDQLINWTIEVDSGNMDRSNVSVIDALDVSKNTFKSGSLSIDGTKVDDSYFNDNGLNYTFDEIKSGETKVIKFQSEPSSDILMNQGVETSITNTATLKIDGKSDQSATATAKVKNDFIYKAGIYNSSTKSIDWTITVNKSQIEFEDPIITDELPDNLSLNKSSVTIDGDSISDSEFSYNDSDRTFIYNLASDNNQHTIKFSTYISSDVIQNTFNSTVKFKNSVKLDVNDRSYTYTASDVSVGVTGDVLSKAAAGYDKDTKEITWKIYVNNIGITIDNAKVTEFLDSNQEYVEGSIECDKLSDIQIEKVDATANPTRYPNQYEISLGTITEPCVITFKTKIAYDSIFAENSDVNITNSAEFTTSETSQKINCSKNITIDNYLIQKDYTYTTGDDYVTWKVNINKNNVTLNSMKITDTIPDGLQIDMDSIKLYEVQFDSNGTAISADNTEVSSSEYTTSYDYTSRNFVLDYTNETNKSYLLEFDTIANTSGGAFTNNIRLDSNGSDYTSSKQSSAVQFLEDLYGGGASETSGTIVITKVNKDNNSETLSGAKFALIRNGKILQVSEVTGTDGKATFKRLKFGTEYSIQEITAPYGYVLDDTLYTFTITKGQYTKNVKTYQFADEKICKTIELYKKSLNGNPLKDAEFKLYLSSDTSYSNPLKTSVSDENGKVVFDDVEQGDYIIKESSAPKGYVLSDEDIIKATVNGSGNYGDVIKADPYEVTNESIKKSIRILKTSEENVPLEGATFALYNTDDTGFENILKEATSDAEGVVVFENVDYGNYVVKEVNAPQGYDLSSVLTNVSESDFVKDENSNIMDLGAIIDTKTKEKVITTIEFYKSTPSGNPLKGAIFALYSETDNEFTNALLTTVSDDNGLVKFNNIVEGNYKIKETKAPDGYNLSDTVIHVTDSEFNDEETIKTNPYNIVDELKAVTTTNTETSTENNITSKGTVVDSKGNTVKSIETQATVESDGSKTVLVKSQDAVAFEQSDGKYSTLNDFSKLGFSSSDVTVLSNGNIQIKDLNNGTEIKFNVTFDLGNGQKVVIGTIYVTVSETGDVSLVSQLIDPYGVITDKDTGKAISGVNITIYYAYTDRNKVSGKTPGTVVTLPIIDGFKPNNNANPQVSDANGIYGFMVFPATDYYIVATKDGYNKYTSPTISVEQEIVKFDIQMTQSTGNSSSSSSKSSSSSSSVNKEDTNSETDSHRNVNWNFIKKN